MGLASQVVSKRDEEDDVENLSWTRTKGDRDAGDGGRSKEVA